MASRRKPSTADTADTPSLRGRFFQILAEQFGGDRNRMSQEAFVDKRAITNIIKRGANPGPKTIDKLVSNAGVDRHWLLTGALDAGENGTPRVRVAPEPEPGPEPRPPARRQPAAPQPLQLERLFTLFERMAERRDIDIHVSIRQPLGRVSEHD